MRGRRPEIKRFVIVLLAVVALPSCLGAARRGVGVKSLAADLVFGIPPLEEPAAPPDVVPTDVNIRDVGAPPKEFGRGAIPAAPPTAACDEPEVNEVAVQAGDNINGPLPAAGTYRWKQSGYQTYPPPIGRINISSFANRVFSEVKPLQDRRDSQWTMEMLEISTGSSVSMTFNVITSRPDPRAGPNVVRDQGQINGVFLTKIRREYPDRRQFTFTANPPVLYLPLPVTVGYTASSQSSDPTTLQTMTHSINVRGRQRYNACGTLVDSWFVDAEQSFAGQDQSASGKKDYNYAIATQMGGVIVFEHVESPCDTYDPAKGGCTTDGLYKYDANIGQLTPRST
jgi:hypothetical protein